MSVQTSSVELSAPQAPRREPAGRVPRPERPPTQGSPAGASAERGRRIPRRWRRGGVRVLALLGALAIWHVLSVTRFNFGVSFEHVPTPLAVVTNLAELLGGEKFYVHVAVSVERVLIAFSLATVSGVLLGMLMGRLKVVEDIVLPYVEVLRPIPAVAWIPLAILMWPTEESSIVFITYLGAFFPIVLNTVHGVEQTPEVLVRAAQSLGAGRRAVFWEVILPGALPSITTGLAIGMGVCWFSLLAGEIISGQYGIGYFTWAAYTLVEYPNIVIGMLTIGGLGTLSTYLVRLSMKPFLRWDVKERT